jgi:hypothetical protein
MYKQSNAEVMLVCRYNRRIFTKQIISDNSHVLINKQLVSFQSCFGVYLVLCQGKGSTIFIYFSVSTGKASLCFVASNMVPASHRFSGYLLGLLIRRMEHKIALSTYECTNISPTMKLQQNVASTVGVAQAVQWLCTIVHSRSRMLCSLQRPGGLRGSTPRQLMKGVCHYVRVTVELLDLWACNTFTFTRYNETNKLHWSH